MTVFLKIILAIIIETIIYCLIPTIVRLLRKKPLSKKGAIYLTVVNYGIVFALLRVLLSKMTNVDYTNISSDILSLLLTIANYFILTYDTKNKINGIKRKQNDEKKKSKIIIISLIATFIVVSSIVLITGNNDDKEKTNDTSNVINYSVKEIKSKNEFENIISNKEYTIFLFTQSTCVFCKNAKPTLESFSESHKLTNVYHFENDESYDLHFEIDGYPTYAIYKNGQFIAKQLGFSNDSNFRLTLAAFLRENNVME